MKMPWPTPGKNESNPKQTKNISKEDSIDRETTEYIKSLET